MQRLCDMTRQAHHYYVMGSIPIDRAAVLVSKFQGRFQIDKDKYARARLRNAGYASTRLMMYLPAADAEQLLWVLVHCPGAEPDKTERWRDARVDRIVITGYELVRLTKPQEPRPNWTWRYTRERESELRDELIRCIRSHRDRELAQLIETIWRTPGFAGARAQVKKMADLIRREWKLRRKSSDPMPPIPARLGYLQRVADKGVTLSKLQADCAAGQTTVVGTRRVPKVRMPDPNRNGNKPSRADISSRLIEFPVISPELLDAGRESDEGEPSSS